MNVVYTICVFVARVMDIALNLLLPFQKTKCRLKSRGSKLRDFKQTIENTLLHELKHLRVSVDIYLVGLASET